MRTVGYPYTRSYDAPQASSIEVDRKLYYHGETIEVYFGRSGKRGFIDGDNRWHSAEIVRIRGHTAILKLKQSGSFVPVDWVANWRILAPLGTHLGTRVQRPQASSHRREPQSLSSYLVGADQHHSYLSASPPRPVATPPNRAPPWQHTTSELAEPGIASPPSRHATSELQSSASLSERAPPWQHTASELAEPGIANPPSRHATSELQSSASLSERAPPWQHTASELAEPGIANPPSRHATSELQSSASLSEGAESGMPPSLDKELVYSVLVDARNYKQAAEALSEVACNGLLSPDEVSDVLLAAAKVSQGSTGAVGGYRTDEARVLPLEDLQYNWRAIYRVADCLDDRYREFLAASRQEEALSEFAPRAATRNSSANPLPSAPPREGSLGATGDQMVSDLDPSSPIEMHVGHSVFPDLDRELSDLAPPKAHREMTELAHGLFEDALANSCHRTGNLSRASRIEINDTIDFKEPRDSRWQMGVVVQLSKDWDGNQWVKVGTGATGTLQEWVPVGSGRLALAGRFSTAFHHPFVQGDHVDILDRYRNKSTHEWEEKWRPGKVEAAGQGFVEVSYDGWPVSYDETIDLLRDGHRVRPFGKHTAKEASVEAKHRDQEQAFFDNLAAQSPPLYIHEVAGDGNCVYRSVCHQVYGSDARHGELRSHVVAHIRDHHDVYAPFIEEDMDAYLVRSQEPGFWAGQVELTAISEIFNAPVEIYHRESPPTSDGTIVPQTVVQGELAAPRHDQAPIRLSYHDRCHYNSVIERDPTHHGGYTAYSENAPLTLQGENGFLMQQQQHEEYSQDPRLRHPGR